MDMTLPKLDVRVRPFEDASGRPTKLLAFAELIIADSFVIKGIRVLRREEAGNDEPFVVFPAGEGQGRGAGPLVRRRPPRHRRGARRLDRARARGLPPGAGDPGRRRGPDWRPLPAGRGGEGKALMRIGMRIIMMG